MTPRLSMMLLLAGIPILIVMPTYAQDSAIDPSDVGELHLVAILTGPASINETDTAYGVYSTDLGHTFEHGDEIYMIFGDTFGQFRGDWRSNVAAVLSTDQDPSVGLFFDRMITDRPGHAKELLASKKLDGDEITVIPTYGVSTGARMVLHYMSVREWGTPGRWELNMSGLAYSDDDGHTWIKDPDATWPGNSNFGQVAIEKVEGFTYIFGIPGGRFGGVQLARIEEEQILNLNSHEFWDGSSWQSDEEAAKTIIPAPVGELSVRWNSHYEQWLMMYLNEDKYSIVLRTADCLSGPWSEERTIATGTEWPQLYAPFMLPRWNDGPELYFTMSLFGPYQVYLMQTSLFDVEPSSAEPKCVALDD